MKSFFSKVPKKKSEIDESKKPESKSETGISTEEQIKKIEEEGGKILAYFGISTGNFNNHFAAFNITNEVLDNIGLTREELLKSSNEQKPNL